MGATVVESVKNENRWRRQQISEIGVWLLVGVGDCGLDLGRWWILPAEQRGFLDSIGEVA